MLHPGRPATLANWQQGPFNRWSFLDVDRVVPTAAISRGGAPVPPFAVRERDILDVRVPRVSGDPGSVADVLRETDTDAFLVLVDGVIVHESYANTGGGNSRHLVMSVTESFVGVVAGILADRGILDLDGQITDHVREVVGFGYDEASVRHLLDMRSGIAFSEEYLNPDAEVRILEHAASWRPYQAGLPPRHTTICPGCQPTGHTAGCSATDPAKPTSSARSASGQQASIWPLCCPR